MELLWYLIVYLLINYFSVVQITMGGSLSVGQAVKQFKV